MIFNGWRTFANFTAGREEGTGECRKIATRHASEGRDQGGERFETEGKQHMDNDNKHRIVKLDLILGQSFHSISLHCRFCTILYHKNMKVCHTSFMIYGSLKMPYQDTKMYLLQLSGEWSINLCQESSTKAPEEEAVEDQPSDPWDDMTRSPGNDELGWKEVKIHAKFSLFSNALECYVIQLYRYIWYYHIYIYVDCSQNHYEAFHSIALFGIWDGFPI